MSVCVFIRHRKSFCHDRRLLIRCSWRQYRSGCTYGTDTQQQRSSVHPRGHGRSAGILQMQWIVWPHLPLLLTISDACASFHKILARNAPRVTGRAAGHTQRTTPNLVRYHKHVCMFMLKRGPVLIAAARAWRLFGGLEGKGCGCSKL